MKNIIAFLFSTAALVPAQTLLFQDNFNVANNANFNNASTAGRLTGTLAADVVLRSNRGIQTIQNNQLLLTTGNTGVRFENAAGPFASTNRFNWASGATGTTILNSGGFVVSFVWTPANNTGNQWIQWAVGTPNADTGGSIVNTATTDYGILLRNNGGTQRFDNSLLLGGDGTFATTDGGTRAYAVTLTYTFANFADGTNVTAVTTVDGTQVANDTFQWDGNGGALHMELSTNNSGNFIDNLAVSALDFPSYFISLTGDTFISGASQGTLIGNLESIYQGNPENSTYSLVAGEGDTDNNKFQINGSTLEVGNVDFTGANSTDAQTFTVRVQGQGTETSARSFILTLTKDDDADNLNDLWETLWAGNLTDLSALVGDEDFDQDGLTDLQEFDRRVTYPNLDPTKLDTDLDTLSDGEEVNPTGTRPATNPTLSDTDFDGLSDLVETNSGSYVDASETGTNPTKCDTDGDYASDSWEITHNTNPFIESSYPGPIGAVTIVPITDDASTGIDPGKTYTHLISGGQSVVVNGVTFDALTTTAAPVGFSWDTLGRTKAQLVNRSDGWDGIAAGAGPGTQALLTTFTYSGNGTAPGNGQRYILSNLTPGTNYNLRIYSRTWSLIGSGRPIDYVFTNGTEIVQPFNSLPTDRPGIITRSGNHNDAYYLNFNYTAQGTELVIDATIPLCSIPVSGSLHLYGLSNEVATGGPLGQILVTNHILTPAGQFVIAFKAKPQTTYNVTKSTNLVGDFDPLETPLTATTDMNGDGQAIIPATETSDLKEFYRIEE